MEKFSKILEDEKSSQVKIQIMNMVSLPKAIHKFNAIFHKLLR